MVDSGLESMENEVVPPCFSSPPVSSNRNAAHDGDIHVPSLPEHAIGLKYFNFSVFIHQEGQDILINVFIEIKKGNTPNCSQGLIYHC